jgi:nitrite reductase (NADH) large subunit
MRFSSLRENTIRHIHTSFDQQNCQCDREEALHLSIELEKELEYLLLPHKVEVGVSGCKHSETDMLVTDICVIGLNNKWEIYVGGSISPSIQQGELFTVAKTNQEAKALICGFVQYYRETANYLEKICDWIERVGLIHIREVIFEDSLRRQLIGRLEAEMLQFTGKLV